MVVGVIAENGAVPARCDLFMGCIRFGAATMRRPVPYNLVVSGEHGSRIRSLCGMHDVHYRRGDVCDGIRVQTPLQLANETLLCRRLRCFSL